MVLDIKTVSGSYEWQDWSEAGIITGRGHKEAFELLVMFCFLPRIYLVKIYRDAFLCINNYMYVKL